MRRGPTALLSFALALGAGGPAWGAPHGDGTDHALQREMDRLYALRSSDPQAFVAQARSLDSLPLPTNLAQREYLQLIQANRATFEGRVPDAIALATPLADSAEDPALRLRAGIFVVNMQASTRDFEAGLRRLGLLLDAHRQADTAMREEVNNLHASAAIFYNELGQFELARRYGEYVLQNAPTARQTCMVAIVSSTAKLALGESGLDEATFRDSMAACSTAGETAVGIGFLDLAHARFLRGQQRLPEALDLLAERLGPIESTRYPRLTSEAYALDAEMLLEAGRVAAAERQARHALVLAKDSPTSLPVAMAEKVLYEVHRRRGEAGAALEHLQRHVAANRALAEESRIKELAFRTVQHETLQREQALRLMTERNRVLDLEARVAKAESRNALLVAGLMLLALAGMAAWGWRLRRQEQRFRQLARTDSLTGFANRMHFTEQAEAALVRSREQGRPLMLISFDLDHFKRINDRHGHLAGDAVLRAVSDAVRAVSAEGLARVVGRIGGEEFAVLLEGASAEQAREHAEALRRAIAGARAPVEAGADLTITASFGVTGTHESGHQLHALMACSDRALYRAKNDGRDRVIVADRVMALEAA